MDLLDIVKDKVEPGLLAQIICINNNLVQGYVDGSKDLVETKVSKRVKVFTQQVHKGVTEMEVKNESSFSLSPLSLTLT